MVGFDVGLRTEDALGLPQMLFECCAFPDGKKKTKHIKKHMVEGYNCQLGVGPTLKLDKKKTMFDPKNRFGHYVH